MNLFSRKLNTIKSLAILGMFLLVATYCVSLVALAAPNPQINYQGKLTGATNIAVADGTYTMVFNLYATSTGGTTLWTETRSGGNKVTVTSGLFSVMLGSITSLSGVNFDQTLHLGVTIEADSEMSPRKILGTVPAAFEANNSNTVGGVASTSIVRNDRIVAIATTSAATLLTVTQNGSGKVLDLFSSAANIFTVLNNGNVGIGSSTPNSRLTVVGNTFLGGNLIATGTLAISGTSTFATTTISSSTIDTLTLNNALAALSGGTGFNSYATGDFIYASGVNTLAKRTIGGTGNIISVVGGVPTWIATSTLGIVLSDTTGTLAVNRGGTGTTTLSGLLQGNGSGAITAITGTAGQFAYYNGTNTLAATSSIFLAANGNFGVGTTTPNAKFTIVGDQDILPGTLIGTGAVTDGSSSATGLAGACQVAVRGNYAYVTGHIDDTVQVLNTANPAAITGIGVVSDGTNGANTLNGACTIALSGNYAYVGSDVDDGVQILDISNPTNPVGVGAITDGTGGATELDGIISIAIKGHYAYIASFVDDGVQILDISNPTNPVGVGAITDGSSSANGLDGAYSIAVVGNYAYVASYVDNGVQILDISNPANPFGVGFIADGTNGATELLGATEIAVVGNLAYVASFGDDGVQILDISNPANPIGIGAITDNTNGATSLGGAIDISIAGNYAYVVSSQDNSVQILDISSSTNPVGVGAITDGTGGATELLGARGIETVGNTVYVAAETDNGFQMIDLGGFTAPTSNIGILKVNDLWSNRAQIAQNLFVDGGVSIGQNALIGGTLVISGQSSSTLMTTNSNPSLLIQTGNVGIGTSTPTNKLTVGGTFLVTGTSTLATTTISSSTITSLNLTNALGALSGGTSFNSYATGDFIFASGVNTLAKRTVGSTGDVLSVVSGVPTWVATSSLGLGGGSSLFTDGGATTYLTSLTDNLSVGSTTANSKLDVWGNFQVGTSSVPNLFVNTAGNFVGLGTTTQGGSTALLTIAGHTAIGTNSINFDGSIDRGLSFDSANRAYIQGLSGAAYNFTVRNTSPAVGSASAINFYHGSNLSNSAIDSILNAGNNTDLAFTTSLGGTETERMRLTSSGNLSIGTTASSSRLTVGGTFLATGTSTLATTTATDLTLSGAFRDSTNAPGTIGMVLQTTGTSTRWVATSTLGITSPNFFTDGGATTYLTDTTDNFGIGTTSSPSARLTVAGNINISSGTGGLSLNGVRMVYGSTTNNSTFVGLDAGRLTTAGDQNTGIGLDALELSTSTVANTAVGFAALQSATAGWYNTAVGASALISNTIGQANTAVGVNAMRLNIDGYFNTSFGNATLYSNTSGIGNTAIGYNTMGLNTIGSSNVAIGQDSLSANSSGTQNTAIGVSAGSTLTNNQFEGRNTLIGYNTGAGITTGINNTIIGANVTGLAATLSDNIIIADGQGNQRINVGSTGNVGIGSTSPSSRLTVIGSGFFGGNLTATGTLAITGTSTLATTTISSSTIGTLNLVNALGALSGGTSFNSYATGDFIYASGVNTLAKRTVGSTGDVLSVVGGVPQWVATSTLGISGGSLFTDAGTSTYLTSLTDNLAIGSTSAGTNRLSVAGNINIDNGSGGLLILGTRVLYASSTNSSTLVGSLAGFSLLSTGINNTAIGFDSLKLATSSDDNTAIGFSTLAVNTSGYQNTAVGSSALTSNTTGFSNNAFGVSALNLNVSGRYNNAFGSFALEVNTTGIDNTAFGDSALSKNTTGNSNTALGNSALFKNKIGDDNIAIGQNALYNNASSTGNISIGSSAGFDLINLQFDGRNTLIGYNTGRGITTGINNTIIGANVTGLSPTLANNIIIADGVGTQRLTIDASGNMAVGTTTITGSLRMGTTSIASRFNLDVAGFNTAGTAGLNRYYTSTNAASGTVQFGELGYVRVSATATTTLVGSMFRVEDSTTFGNTIRGLEVQTNRGTNTRGENTALSGFARTFGVRGFTSADAGGVFEPAGGYFETGGTTQGNAIRGYSATITSASLSSLFQDTSTFSGTGLQMNLGNSGGSFTGKFLDLQVAGVSRFTVASTGAAFLSGALSINATSTDPAANNIVGMNFATSGLASINRSAGVAMNLGRSNDGSVLEFYSAGAVQGGVSIAGATVSYNAFTGSHFGLTSGVTYDMGTVLALTGETDSYNDDSESEILYGMTENITENNPKVIGSYLSVLEPSRPESHANPTLVMAVGNGGMWVADQGEDIAQGDYLISSNIAGHAELDTKTADMSYVIARASENIDWNEVTEEVGGVKHKRITVFYENFDRPNIVLAAIASSSYDLTKLTDETPTERFLAGLVESLVAWFGNAQNGIGDMYANVFNASERICVDGECLSADDIRGLKGALQSGSSNNPPAGNSGGDGGTGGSSGDGTEGSTGQGTGGDTAGDGAGGTSGDTGGSDPGGASGGDVGAVGTGAGTTEGTGGAGTGGV